MKKTIGAGLLTLGILIGGVGGVLAAGSYYTGEIENAMSYQKQAINKQYDKKHEEIEQQIFQDANAYTTQEIDRITEESNKYLDQQLEKERNERTQARYDEIHTFANQKLEEMKKYIDDLIQSGGTTAETNGAKG